MIKFIIGKAGTGKTYSTIQSFLTQSIVNVLCLAFTHSAVNNMKNYATKRQFNQKFTFSTLHKFFHLPIPFKPINRIPSLVSDDNKPFTHVIIDEFSLIPLDIMKYILDCVKNSIVPVIFIGDLLQLPPIADIEDKSFDFQFFRKNTEIWNKIDRNLEVGYYLSNTIFTLPEYQKSDKMILTHNYRSNDEVMKILNNIFHSNSTIQPEIPISDVSTLFDLEYSEDITIIASEYKLLTKALNKMKHYKGTYPTKIGLVKSNKCILNETISADFLNGDIVFQTQIINDEAQTIRHSSNDESVEITNLSLNQKITVHPNKLLPYNFITVHKSQGRGYDNVILILNDLFEITMLYTAITRARKSIKFIFFGNLQNFHKIKNINEFNLLENIIYSES